MTETRSPVPVQAPHISYLHPPPHTHTHTHIWSYRAIETEERTKFYCSDAASGNGPLHLPGAADVCSKPGARIQSGGRPLRRLLEPDQHQVSAVAAHRAGFPAESGRCFPPSPSLSISSEWTIGLYSVDSDSASTDILLTRIEKYIQSIVRFKFVYAVRISRYSPVKKGLFASFFLLPVVPRTTQISTGIFSSVDLEKQILIFVMYYFYFYQSVLSSNVTSTHWCGSCIFCLPNASEAWNFPPQWKHTHQAYQSCSL